MQLKHSLRPVNVQVSPVMPLNVTPFLSRALIPPPADQTRRPDSFEKPRWAPLKQEMWAIHTCLWQEDTATVNQRAELRAAEHAIFATQESAADTGATAHA